MNWFARIMPIQASLAIARQAYGSNVLHMEHIKQRFMFTNTSPTSCHIEMKPKKWWKEKITFHFSDTSATNLNFTQLWNSNVSLIWKAVTLIFLAVFVLNSYCICIKLWLNYSLTLDYVNHDHMLTFPSLDLLLLHNNNNNNIPECDTHISVKLSRIKI